ncbi:MAG: hypothetical protein ABIA04_04610 [Pseudomonadota bacterium]
MTEVRAFCVGFYENAKQILKAIEVLPWCDTFYCEQRKGDPGGMPGTVENLQKLNINYKAYNTCLTFNDAFFNSLKLLSENCYENGIQIYANEHGYDKSVLQIEKHSPNVYAKYWNAMGPYWMDRFKLCVKKNPLSRRWISIGSLRNDYLYKYFRWDKNRHNGKVLVLHEPDTDLCERDNIPLKPSSTTKRTIEILNELNIAFDFKLHPSWSNFVGNLYNDNFLAEQSTGTGAKLWKPDNCMMVNIDLAEMRNYSLVIGCYSSALLDAVSMDIPVINVSFDYPTKLQSHWGPGEMGLFPRYSVNQLKEAIPKHLNLKMNYDFEKVKYFLGPLGKVSENYKEFIEKDFNHPKKQLGIYYFKWRKEFLFFRINKNHAFSVSLDLARRLIRLIRKPSKIKKLADINFLKMLLESIKRGS